MTLGQAGRTPRTASAFAVVVALGLLPACGAAAGSSVSVAVTPATALYDQPFTTLVRGLAPGQDALLRLTTTASDGTVWTSVAEFHAGGDGTYSTGLPPPGGSATDVDPMRLAETLTPGRTDAMFSVPQPWTMTETVVVAGADVAAATIHRQYPADVGVRSTTETLSASGVYGRLFLPPAGAARAPGVVVFGGSEGGLSTTAEAAALAAHGYPALALAYFGEPGLPAHLENIPLEYFATAARFLAARPEVDPARVVLWGTSRGSEAALLTAAHYPRLVRGVVGAVPSAEALPGLPDTTQPAWTLGGHGVPTAPPGTRSEDVDDRATIPVEDVAGPVLLVCGGQDRVWASCPNSEVISTRLTSRHRAAPTLLTYPNAGHFVGSLLPYVPSTLTQGRTAEGVLVEGGGSFPDDQAARARAWPLALVYLRRLTA